MRQAITTKFLPPTNFRGARIKATASAGSLTISWDYALSVEQNHAKAARMFAEKWEWLGTWTGGALPKGGYVFTLSLPFVETFTIK